MKRCFALLLSVLLLTMAVPTASADIIYNDDQLNWGGMYDPDAPCPHRTRTHYEAVAPTCAQTGHGAYAVCNDCGIVLEGSDATLPLVDHTYDNACDADCNGCGAVRDAEPHAYKSEVWVEATCGSDGEMHYVCAVCGDAYTDTIPATGKHTYDNACDADCNGCGVIRQVGEHTYEMIREIPSTCSAEGLRTYACSACGRNYMEVIPATGAHTYDNACDAYCNVCRGERPVSGHVYDNGGDTECNICGAHRDACNHVYDNACDPSCNVAGCGYIRQVGDHLYSNLCDADCNECGAIRQVGDHSYAMTETRPTCETEGSKVYRCVYCGHSYTEVVPALGHDYDAVVTAPTCYEEGYTTHTCVHCGGSYVDAYVFATNHEKTTVTVPGRDATCTQDGLTERIYCTACGVVFEEAAVISASGHAAVLVPGYAATCTKDGLTDGRTCFRCGEVIVAQQTIPAAHTPVAYEKGPTCTEPGISGAAKCIVCGEMVEVGTVIPALGHIEVGVFGYAATCTEDGLTDGYVCAVCGEVLVEQEAIPAKGHTTAVAEGFDATCIEPGLTAGTYCPDCGHVFVAQEVIAPREHSYQDENDFDCDVCGFIRDVTIKGDADGDGRINNRDLGCLQQYLNERPVTINVHAVDMDGNGRLNNRDLGLFQRYLNSL